MIAEPTYEYISDHQRQIEQTVEIMQSLALQTVLVSDELAHILKSQDKEHQNSNTNMFDF